MTVLKKCTTIFFLGILAVGLVSCGGSKADTTTSSVEGSISSDITATMDITAFTTAAIENAGYPEMIEITEKQIPTYFPSLDISKLEEVSINLEATSSVADELCVFKVKEEADIAMIDSAIQEHSDKLIVRVKSYNESQVPRIENALILKKGNYVVYAITDNPDAVEAVFTEYYK